MLLGVLVEQFGMFVRERYDVPPEAEADEPFPMALVELHNSFGHHIIPLALLSRADGDSCPEERKVIVEHCLALAQLSGLDASGKARAALEEYVDSFRPTLMQLDPALHRLERGPAEHVAAFLAAARALVQADGVERPEEVRFLANLASACSVR